jgi:hypothetical protein
MTWLRIPRHTWWLAALAVLIFGGSLFVWLMVVWTPVQRYYLGTYLRCSWPDTAPAASVEIQWLYKTAPGSKPELASGADAVSTSSESGDRLGMKLSPEARQLGWMGLVEGAAERLPVSALKPRLEDLIFDGQSLWLMVFWPFFCGFLLFYFALFGMSWLEDWLPDAPWKAQQFPWDEPAQSLLRKWIKRAQALRTRRSELLVNHTRSQRLSSAVTVQPATPTAPPESQAAGKFIQFDAKTETRFEGFLWTEKDEIE